MWKSAFYALAGLAALGMASPSQASEPIGVWSAGGGESHIEIEQCQQGYCGHIVWLAEPRDERGQPKVDKHTRQPIMGLQILRGMRPAREPNVWKGQVYNPRDGKTYKASIALESRDVLTITGCLLIFCRSQNWTRVSPGS